jgi:hypothetical protein
MLFLALGDHASKIPDLVVRKIKSVREKDIMDVLHVSLTGLNLLCQKLDVIFRRHTNSQQSNFSHLLLV